MLLSSLPTRVYTRKLRASRMMRRRKMGEGGIENDAGTIPDGSPASEEIASDDWERTRAMRCITFRDFSVQFLETLYRDTEGILPEEGKVHLQRRIKMEDVSYTMVLAHFRDSSTISILWGNDRSTVKHYIYHSFCRMTRYIIDIFKRTKKTIMIEILASSADNGNRCIHTLL